MLWEMTIDLIDLKMTYRCRVSVITIRRYSAPTEHSLASVERRRPGLSDTSPGHFSRTPRTPKTVTVIKFHYRGTQMTTTRMTSNMFGMTYGSQENV